MTMGRRLLSLALAVGLAALSRYAQGENYRTAIRRQVVQIEARLQGGATACGSGLWVSKNVIMSALHVLRPELEGTRPVEELIIRSPEQQEIHLRSDAYRVEPTDANARYEPLDVGFLVLNEDMSSFESSLTARAEDDDLLETDAFILSYQPATPVTAPGSVEANRTQCPNQTGTTLQPANIEGVAEGDKDPTYRLGTPRAANYRHQATRRIMLATHESPGFSGSPVVSRTLEKVIAIYTRADDKKGYATALTDVAPLYDSVATERLPRVYRVPVPPTFWFSPQTEFSLPLGAQEVFQTQSRPLVALGALALLDLWASPGQHTAFGVAGGAWVFQGELRDAYLSPYDGTELQTRRDAYWGLGVEAGAYVALLRKSGLHPLVTLGFRGTRTYYQPPEELKDPAMFWFYGPFARVHALIMRPGAAWGMTLSLTTHFDWTPLTNYQYRGVAGEAGYQGGHSLVWSLAGGIGAIFDVERAFTHNSESDPP